MRTLLKKVTLIEALYSGRAELFYFDFDKNEEIVLQVIKPGIGSMYSILHAGKCVASVYVDYNYFYHDRRNYRLIHGTMIWNNAGNAFYNIFDYVHNNKPLYFEGDYFYFLQW